MYSSKITAVQLLSPQTQHTCTLHTYLSNQVDHICAVIPEWEENARGRVDIFHYQWFVQILLQSTKCQDV